MSDVGTIETLLSGGHQVRCSLGAAALSGGGASGHGGGQAGGGWDGEVWMEFWFLDGGTLGGGVIGDSPSLLIYSYLSHFHQRSTVNLSCLTTISSHR